MTTSTPNAGMTNARNCPCTKAVFNKSLVTWGCVPGSINPAAGITVTYIPSYKSTCSSLEPDTHLAQWLSGSRAWHTPGSVAQWLSGSVALEPDTHLGASARQHRPRTEPITANGIPDNKSNKAASKWFSPGHAWQHRPRGTGATTAHKIV